MTGAILRQILVKTAFVTMLCSQSAVAEEVRYLDNPWLTLSAMFSSITQAKESIDLTYYEFDPCSTSTKTLIKALADKKAQNPKIRIRLLADAWPFYSADHARALAAELRSYGIEFRLFNPPRFLSLADFNFTDPGRRTHAKYLLIDPRSNPLLVIGSTNINDAHFGMNSEMTYASKPINFLDRNVWVRGPVALSALAHFEWMWTSLQVRQSTELTGKRFAKFKKGCLARNRAVRELETELLLNAEGTLNASPVFQCANVKFAGDNTNFYQLSELEVNHQANVTRMQSEIEEEKERIILSKATVRMILDLLSDKGVKNISMENYIYAPYGKIAEVLKARAREKIPVVLYTNYFQGSGEIFEQTHNKSVSVDSRGTFKIFSVPTIDRPGQRWRFTPLKPAYQNHSKIFVTNGQNLVVSSFNLDPRSYRINIESAIGFYNCPALAARAETISAELINKLSKSQEKALLGRSHGRGFKIDSTYWSDIRDVFAAQHY